MIGVLLLYLQCHCCTHFLFTDFILPIYKLRNDQLFTRRLVDLVAKPELYLNMKIYISITIALDSILELRHWWLIRFCRAIYVLGPI